MRRSFVVGLAVAVPSVLFPVPAGGAQQRVITAFLFRYNPSPADIAPGDSLAFVNMDPLAGEGHSVTQVAPPGEQLFDSIIVPPGGAGEVIGASELPTGSYRITCRVHAYMSGTLEVGRRS